MSLTRRISGIVRAREGKQIYLPERGGVYSEGAMH